MHIYLGTGYSLPRLKDCMLLAQWALATQTAAMIGVGFNNDIKTIGCIYLHSNSDSKGIRRAHWLATSPTWPRTSFVEKFSAKSSEPNRLGQSNEKGCRHLHWKMMITCIVVRCSITNVVDVDVNDVVERQTWLCTEIMLQIMVKQHDADGITNIIHLCDVTIM